MHIIRKPGWALPEHMATPENLFWNRRAVLAGMAGAGAIALGTGLPSADDVHLVLLISATRKRLKLRRCK